MIERATGATSAPVRMFSVGKHYGRLLVRMLVLVPVLTISTERLGHTQGAPAQSVQVQAMQQFEQAKNLYNQGNLQKARTLLSQSVSLVAHSAAGLPYFLATLHQRLGETDDALGVYLAFIKSYERHVSTTQTGDGLDVLPTDEPLRSPVRYDRGLVQSIRERIRNAPNSNMWEQCVNIISNNASGVRFGDLTDFQYRQCAENSYVNLFEIWDVDDPPTSIEETASDISLRIAGPKESRYHLSLSYLFVGTRERLVPSKSMKNIYATENVPYDSESGKYVWNLKVNMQRYARHALLYYVTLLDETGQVLLSFGTSYSPTTVAIGETRPGPRPRPPYRPGSLGCLGLVGAGVGIGALLTSGLGLQPAAHWYSNQAVADSSCAGPGRQILVGGMLSCAHYGNNADPSLDRALSPTSSAELDDRARQLQTAALGTAITGGILIGIGGSFLLMDRLYFHPRLSEREKPRPQLTAKH